MNHLSARFMATLTMLSLFAAGQSRADFMNWSYSTQAVPGGFAVNLPDNNGGGAIQLTPYNNAAGSSLPINVLAYQTTATAPVTFNAQDSTYTLTLTITDNTTGHSGDLTFTGSISGGLDKDTSSLVNTFATTQGMLVLDGHTYTVTLPPSTHLVDPTQPQNNIAATIRVSDNGGVQGAPEPTSLVLGGLGFSLFGAGGLWQRLRRPIQQTV